MCTIESMPREASAILETFLNAHPQRAYTVRLKAPEFTCLCPKTGQPDFAIFHIEYIPDKLCLELKSLKRYLWSYREVGAFHEKVTNDILDDCVAVCQPQFMKVTGEFNVRGGVYTTVVAEYSALKQPL